MRTLSKTIELTDYEKLSSVPAMRTIVESLTADGVRIDVGNDHRYWEAGMAIKALMQAKYMGDVNIPVSVLDVGAGLSLVGPSLSILYNCVVTEIEPEVTNWPFREKASDVLRSSRKNGLNWLDGSFQKYDFSNRFDAVFCLSVVEHMSLEEESSIWPWMVKACRPGGIVFATTDIVPIKNKSYHFDNLRKTNFTLEMWKERYDRLVSLGMNPLGEFDSEYHGSFVYDYTFGSLAFKKP